MYIIHINVIIYIVRYTYMCMNQFSTSQGRGDIDRQGVLIHESTDSEQPRVQNSRSARGQKKTPRGTRKGRKFR